MSNKEEGRNQIAPYTGRPAPDARSRSPTSPSARRNGEQASRTRRALERPALQKDEHSRARRNNGPTTAVGADPQQGEHTMIRKLLLMLTPVLVLATFSVMPAFAQALESHVYGTCSPGAPQELLVCPEGEKSFVPFAKGTPVKVLSEKAVSSGNIIFESSAGTWNIQCTGLTGSGTDENVFEAAYGAEYGHANRNLVLRSCSVKFEGLTCTVGTSGAGEGAIALSATFKVNQAATSKIRMVLSPVLVKFGHPGLGCPAQGTEVGTLRGEAQGTQVTASKVLAFSKTTGLTLSGSPITITGSSETYTEATGKPVVIN
jgi:hypothetical protein